MVMVTVTLWPQSPYSDGVDHRHVMVMAMAKVSHHGRGHHPDLGHLCAMVMATTMVTLW